MKYLHCITRRLKVKVHNKISGLLAIIAVVAVLLFTISILMKFTGYRLSESVYLIDGYTPVLGYQLLAPIQSVLLSSKVMLVSLLLSVLCFTGLHELNKQ
jgi:uncharacterized membrane protein